MTDREMIELLATKIMGFTPRPNRAWNPLENAADSKQLIAKLRELGWDMVVVARASHDQYGNPPCRASLLVGHFSYELGDARRKLEVSDYIEGPYADTEERAVALCALRVMDSK